MSIFAFAGFADMTPDEAAEAERHLWWSLLEFWGIALLAVTLLAIGIALAVWKLYRCVSHPLPPESIVNPQTPSSS